MSAIVLENELIVEARADAGNEAIPEVGETIPATGRVRLLYLEGIRGWAAIFVALHHVWQFIVTRPDLGPIPAWFSAMTVFKFGGYAVPVFIVLSGYCLMLPVVRSVHQDLSGGLRQFAVRRARRILIPYYAALALGVLLILSYPRLSQPTQTQWDTALPALTAGSLLTHLGLVHNWFERWQWTIDPPMWSIAIEWQIYIVFGLILLPLWRRVGAIPTVAIAFVLGLLPIWFGYGFVSPWFLGLFAFGMLAAALNFAPRFVHRAGNPAMWEIGCAVLWAAGAVLTLLKIDRLASPHPLTDTLIGLGTAMLLVGCTQRLQLGQRLVPIVRLLEHTGSVKLGEFSYSIYLLHYPILAVGYLMLLDQGAAPMTIFAGLTFVVLPIALGLSYAFHTVFERPFMLRTSAEQRLQSLSRSPCRQGAMQSASS